MELFVDKFALFIKSCLHFIFVLVLSFDVDEELPKGTVLFKLTATDPLTGQTVAKYEKLPDSDPNNLIDISPLTGEVINNQILDFESRKEVIFRVRAIVGGQGAQERTR